MKKEDLSKRELQHFRDAFQLFDTNKDNKMSVKELGKVFECLGRNRTPQELQDVLDQNDKDKNDYLDFDEFLQLVLNEAECTALRKTFAEFDLDLDGFVTKEEVLAVMAKTGKGMSPEEVDNYIKEGDLDNNGKIDYKEFVKMAKKYEHKRN